MTVTLEVTVIWSRKLHGGDIMSTKTKYLQSAGEFFHIYNRGVDRNNIFFNDRNFRYFLQRVSASLDPSSMEINAYCLMPNHFHFIVHQITRSAISGFMRGVCDGYAKAINKERSRSGHLFEGKYKMKQIVNDTYLVHLSRYIHLNPVRAGLVRLPEEWQYSSCQVYFGMREEAVISTQPVLEQFGSPRNYKKFVEEYVAEDRKKINNLLF